MIFDAWQISASDAAKTSQDAPRRPQDPPETPQKAPKMRQDPLWAPPRRPKTLPGGPEDTPRGRKITFRERMSSRQGSQGPLGGQLGSKMSSKRRPKWAPGGLLGSKMGHSIRFKSSILQSPVSHVNVKSFTSPVCNLKL